MLLVEKHNFKFNKEMDDLSFESKNFYNAGLYQVRQHFFETGKYLGFNDLYHVMTKTSTWLESRLPRRVCNHAIRLVDQNFKAFFASLKEYKKNPSKFTGRPKLPKYKHKDTGRSVVLYESGAISKKKFKDGIIGLSKTNIEIQTKVENFSDIKQVRIVPKINHFVVEIVYEKECKPQNENGIIAGIDLGLNNLSAITYSDGSMPSIISGRPLKSINQFYNKKKAYLQSKLKGDNFTSKQINILTHKRNNKVNDYLHKASRLLVNQLVLNNVGSVIIGLNKQWKQEINIGRRNNQNFVNIPHSRFIEMIKYKAELEGISVTTREESYTSKCSFLDLEEIKKHEEYKGKRVKRGMFKSSTGRKINADVNGSYNIMRKAIPNVFNNGIEGVAVHPSNLFVKR